MIWQLTTITLINDASTPSVCPRATHHVDHRKFDCATPRTRRYKRHDVNENQDRETIPRIISSFPPPPNANTGCSQWLPKVFRPYSCNRVNVELADEQGQEDGNVTAPSPKPRGSSWLSDENHLCPSPPPTMNIAYWSMTLLAKSNLWWMCGTEQSERGLDNWCLVKPTQSR